MFLLLDCPRAAGPPAVPRTGADGTTCPPATVHPDVRVSTSQDTTAASFWGVPQIHRGPDCRVVHHQQVGPSVVRLGLCLIVYVFSIYDIILSENIKRSWTENTDSSSSNLLDSSHSFSSKARCSSDKRTREQATISLAEEQRRPQDHGRRPVATARPDAPRHPEHPPNAPPVARSQFEPKLCPWTCETGRGIRLLKVFDLFCVSFQKCLY